MPSECDRPPSGWICTRSAGHDGPCAALPAGSNDASGPVDPAEIRADTVAEIVARLRLEAHGRWDRGSYLGAADFIEREFGERDARTHKDGTPKEENA